VLVRLVKHGEGKSIVAKSITPSKNIIQVNMAPGCRSAIVLDDKMNILASPRAGVPDNPGESLVVHSCLVKQQSTITLSNQADVEIDRVSSARY
jgi:hypothetical protein